MENLKPLEVLLTRYENPEDVILVDKAREFLLRSLDFDIVQKGDRQGRYLAQASWVNFVYNLDDELRVRLFESLEQAGLIRYDKLTELGKEYAEIEFSIEHGSD